VDIHKPKPWHGWREFLKEYGIIVLGVLTALALEQAVEWMHWRHVVGEERASLAAMRSEVYATLLARVDMQPCIDARLADVKTILGRHRAGEPLQLKGPIGRPSAGTLSLGALDMAIADQSLSHMPLDEKSSYFDVKDSYQVFAATESIELEAWKTLRALDRAEQFTPADWAEVSKAYDRAVDVNGVLKNDLKSDKPGAWLYPFRDVAKPKQEEASLRSLPWVQELCRSGAVT
jgi:hypothetical protein